ncbi:MAG: sugar-binding domain-containing protein [bacterium]
MLNHVKNIFLINVLFLNVLFGGEWDRLMNLKGYWKFSIGDNMEWASADYNDSDWEEIRVPRSWEDEGFHGYNGYAWYRTSFSAPLEFKGKTLYLYLGYIDDVDEVYVNGKMIGSTGTFPPNYQTAYNAFRKYPIPRDFIKYNKENVISVRVYDSQQSGGIVSGDIGLYSLTSLPIAYSLEGYWKFSTGDKPEWKDSNFNDSKWKDVMVPSLWESQGYQDYDGFAWYRKKVTLPTDLLSKRLVLVMGKIDDFDQVYVNGQLVGQTGDFDIPQKQNFHGTSEYNEFRGYYIPDNLLKGATEVVIAVRVYDGYIGGGIYQGPVGFTTQDKYTNYWKDYKKKEKKNWWEIFFGND